MASITICLLGVEPTAKQLELFQQTMAHHLSVRQLEEAAGRWQPKGVRRRRAMDPQAKEIESELRQLLGTKVALSPRKRGGRIVIEYFSSEDLARILQVLGLVPRSERT